MTGKKANVKKIVIILVVVLLAGGFVAMNLINARRTEMVDGIPRNALPVRWDYPRRQTIVSRVNARGTVDLVERHTVFPETGAQILEVHVRVGDAVEIGDLLVTYDAQTLVTLNESLVQAELALRQAELGLDATRIAPSAAELLSAENAINQARNGITGIESQLEQLDLQMEQIREDIESAERSRNDVQLLFDAGISTRVELENANDAIRRIEAQLDILQTQRDSVAFGMYAALETERIAMAQHDAVLNRNAQPSVVNQARVQQVAIEMAQHNIGQIQRNIDEFVNEERATVAGTVLSVAVREGDISAPGRPLMEIADVSSDNLVIIVHVPENDVGNVRVGQDAEISGGALGTHIYTGYVSLIHPVASPRQMGATMETVLTVEISVENTERLRAGVTVDAEIITQINEDTLVVPLMSTLNEGGGVNFVYVIAEDSTLLRRDVTLGEFSDMYIEAFGVEDGDRVVANPSLQTMQEGMHVRPLNN